MSAPDKPDNLWLLLQPALRKHQARAAWICRRREGRRVVTYAQLRDGALTLAHALRHHDLRIGGGDTVGIMAANGPEFTVAALAAWKIGANIAPIHSENSEYDIARQLQAVAPKLLLIDEALRDRIDYRAVMAIDLSIDAAAVGRENAAPITPESARADHLAARIYTSGSAGPPKVVRLSHGNFASNVRCAARIERFGAHDRFISLLPFSHAMGLLGTMLLPLYCGAAIVAPKALAAAEILETLQGEKISVVIAVPRLFRNVMLGLEKKFAAGGVALAAYRGVLKRAPMWLRRRINAPLRKKFGGHITAWVSGGSHLDSRISRRYHDLGLPLRQGYGLTETAPLTCIQTDIDGSDAALASVGPPIADVQVKIHRPDAQGSGEVWIKGPNVMLGYENAQQNAAALQDGWFKSGDLGHLDARGRLVLSGRAKRLIVTEAGKNIYPEELETLLERDPNIKEAGVLECDMRPACVLAMHSAADCQIPDARAALAAFNALTSAHNRITRYALVDELPRTPLGKTALQELPSIFARHEVKAVSGK